MGPFVEHHRTGANGVAAAVLGVVALAFVATTPPQEATASALLFAAGGSGSDSIRRALDRLAAGETDVSVPDEHPLADAVRAVAERVAGTQRDRADADSRADALFAHTAHPVAAVDASAEPVVDAANEAFEDVVGAEVGARLASCLETDADVVVRAVRRGEPIERDVRISTTDGVGDAVLEYVPIDDATGYVLFTDIERPWSSEQQERRRRLYDVTADPSLSRDEKVDRLLELGREWFDVDNALLSHVDSETGRYHVERVVGDEFADEGDVLSLEDTFCRRAIRRPDILGIYDAVAEGEDNDPGYAVSGIACYIGGRVVVDGDVYGTLCFFDDDPVTAPFTRMDRALVDLMARWVSYELERREREQYLALLERAMAAAPVAISITDATDPDRPIVYANPHFETVTGYDVDDVLGRSPEFLYGDDPSGAAADLLDAPDLASQDATVANYRADGERFWAHVRRAPVVDDDGELTHVVAFREDVTERVRDERRLEAIVENTDFPMYIKDRDGVYVWVNEATVDVFGLDRDDVVGATDADLFDAASVPAIREVDQRVVEEERHVTRETETTVDGERHVWLDNKYPYRNERGEVVGMMGVSHDITERTVYKERLAAERDRYRALVRNLPGMVYRSESTDRWTMRFVSEGCAAVTGYDRDAVADGDVSWWDDVVHPEDRTDAWETIADAVAADDPYDVTYRIRTADGETRWVAERGRRVADGTTDGVLEGYVFDVTDRERRKHALASLHDTTRELLTVEDEAEAADLVVSATVDVLDDAEVAFYRFDAAVNELAAVAATDGFASEDPPLLPVGEESPAWESFVADETRSFADQTAVAGDWTTPVERAGGLLVPVGDHGLLVVVSPDGPPSEAQQRLVETAAASAAAAFDRLSSEAALREREAELAERNERLRRQVNVTGIIRTILQSLVDAESRADVERVVCEGLADSDDISFAWVGDWHADEERVTPREWAGESDGYLDAVSLGGETAEPAVRAARDGEVTVVPDVADRVTAEPWCEHAAASGFGSALAVPLAVDARRHGVLAVYADSPDAFCDLEVEVFGELGETIADALDAVVAREALHADTYVELRLRVPDADTVLSRLQAETGGRITYEGGAGGGEDGTELFVSVENATREAVADALDDLVTVADYTHIASAADGSGAAFEVTVDGETLPHTLARAGGIPRTVVVHANGTDVVVNVPASVDVREYVDRLRATHGEVVLEGRRDVEPAAHSRTAVVRDVFDELTDRQQEVLRTAYLAGFFEWPRQTTGEGVADLLGVSQPTVNRHLRLAQQRLLDTLFGDDPATSIDE